MSVTSVIDRFATRFPRFSRFALWAVSRVNVTLKQPPHWLFTRVAGRLDYRVPVVVALTNGMRAKVPWIDVAGRAICQAGCYEPDTVRVLLDLLKPGAVFLDIGAAFGQYSLLASGAVGHTGRVFAFEPEPVSYAWLCENIQRNDLRNVTPVQLALGNQKGSLELFLGSPDNLGTTSLRRQYNYTGRSVSVPVLPLDEYLRAAGVTHVDVVKMDVEGAEHLVLRGAGSLLAMRPTIIIEFEETNQSRFDYSCRALAQSLHDFGYRLESILGGNRFDYDPSHPASHHSFNVLAIPL